MELVLGASNPFDLQAFLSGKQTPVFFGSAINNFGVREILDALLEWAPSPLPRDASVRTVNPTETAFSGFVFKIQANMDANHRDRIAFLRVCSGHFEHLQTEKLVWEKSFPKGCDRLAIAPDGKEIYVPSFEKEDWYVLDAASGDLKHTISPGSGAHNTIYGLNGKEVYLEGLRSPYLTVINAQDISIQRKVGPFSNSIRPFTVNGKQTRVYANINELLGFEAGDLITGQKLYSLKVNGFEKGPVKRHGCPSHGIALTPDEKELWLADAFNQKIHVYELKGDEIPVQKESISLRDQPGWITFTQSGDFAYPATGEVIDPKTKQILLTLHDEHGIPVQSEKMIEIDFVAKKAVSAGDQFGLGRVR